MKPYERKWTIVQKGNGKFYTRVENLHSTSYWPWGSNEFDTLEEAKAALMAKKEELEKQAKDNEETVVFELK